MQKEEIVIGDIRDFTGLPPQEDLGTEDPEEVKKKEQGIKKLQETFSRPTEVSFEDEEEAEAGEKKKQTEGGNSNVIPATPEVKGDNYAEKVKELIKTGFYEDFEIEDGVFSDSDVAITKEQFAAIVKNQNAWKEEKAQEEVLSKLSPDEQAFLEFKKTGGNLEDYIQTFSFKQKAASLDISTDNGKKQAVFAYYKNFVGWSEDKILKHIERSEKNLELDEEADMAKKHIEAAAEKQHNEVLESNTERIRKEKEAEDKYKESIETTLKKQGVDNKKVSTITKAFLERDKNGYTEIDKMYLTLKGNPEKTSLLYGILSDPEKFLEENNKKVASGTVLKELKKMKVGSKATSNFSEEGDNKQDQNVRSIFGL